MQLTTHATTRMITRTIPISVVEMALCYGRPINVNGAESYMLDNEALELIASDCRDAAKRLERYRGVYVIASNGFKVITAARAKHRLKVH